jgi:hypothetical protein
MANELTYDPTEADQAEFTEEELDSLNVGERLYNEEQSLLAGKFRDAEELESAYLSLQQKLGSREDNADGAEQGYVEENAEEETEYDFSLIDALREQQAAGEFTDEMVAAIEQLSPIEVADMFLQREATPQESYMSEDDVASLQDLVGGQESYVEMVGWAKDNMDPGEVQVYDAIMNRGDPQACYFAIQALALRYQNAQDYDGEMLTGQAPRTTGETFRSQAEVVRAMNDPRYDRDPAYRQDIEDKLSRSDINY